MNIDQYSSLAIKNYTYKNHIKLHPTLHRCDRAFNFRTSDKCPSCGRILVTTDLSGQQYIPMGECQRLHGRIHALMDQMAREGDYPRNWPPPRR